MKREKIISDLTHKAIESIKKITLDIELKITELDEIIDMIFCYFMHGSIRSLPEKLRVRYLKNRLQTLSLKIHATVDDLVTIDCEDCKNGTHEEANHIKETLH